MNQGLAVFLAIVGLAISLAWLMLGYRALAGFESGVESMRRLADAIEKFERIRRAGD